uniref:Uncharacterized protein n=1 Tax=Timema tahoe TaxID=61484 RepID=A0A7R9FN05_9NEOP|nr:unnamed protein product [Timema tahoe]
MNTLLPTTDYIGCIRIVYLCGVALIRALDSCNGNHVTKCRSLRIVADDTYAGCIRIVYFTRHLQEDTSTTPASTIQTPAPDLLGLFTDDGIFSAESGCSTDFWDTASSVRRPPPPAQLTDDTFGTQTDDMLVILAELERLDRPPEIRDGVQAPLGAQTDVTAVISQSEEGYNDVLAELELLDRLLCEYKRFISHPRCDHPDTFLQRERER